MYILINLFIFSIILFLYIHIYYHIKTSNYLEIYEVENVSKDSLEDLCNLKQPILINNITLLDNININYLSQNYNSFDIKIKNRNEEDLYVDMKLITAMELFNKDISATYYSENNRDFLDETTIYKIINTSDLFLRPYNVSFIDYDIIFGSINSYTPFRYNLNCRNYFKVISGKVEITLCPPKNHKYLYVKNNYEYLDYVSLIDINDVQNIYKNDFEKVKLLRIELSSKSLLQIPAYWFYSIKFLETETIVCHYKYKTYMSSVSIIPQLLMKFIQNNNVKTNLTKIIN